MCSTGAASTSNRATTGRPASSGRRITRLATPRQNGDSVASRGVTTAGVPAAPPAETVEAAGPALRAHAARRRRTRPIRPVTRSAFTFSPSSISTAGSTMIAVSIVTSVTAMPAYAIDFRKYGGKTSMTASATMTVAPLNRIVRPAVLMVATTADRLSFPVASSSRNLLTISSA
jgi:hypothetical protein